MQIEMAFCGNPCGGTTFISRYLTNRGYECGHEACSNVYARYPNYVGKVIKGDSSYVLIDFVCPEVPVVMIMRNLLDVLNAYIADKLQKYGSISVNDLMEEILARYKKIEARAIAVIRIEHDLQRLCDLTGIVFSEPTEEEKRSRVHNCGRVRLSWKDLKVQPAFKEFAAYHSRFYAT